MAQVSATRSELLARRARIRLAVQGRDLLKERRSALIGEFDRVGASVLEAIDLLDREVAGAGQLLGIAVAADGREPLDSAAFAAEGGIEVSVRTRSVAGVGSSRSRRARSRARTSRGYSLVATSARIDAVAERFESVLDKFLDVAGLELSVRRLADEIARTTRRMNALEHVVVPRLEAERARISLVLEERELEDRVRLRRMRARGHRGGRDHDRPRCTSLRRRTGGRQANRDRALRTRRRTRCEDRAGRRARGGRAPAGRGSPAGMRAGRDRRIAILSRARAESQAIRSGGDAEAGQLASRMAAARDELVAELTPLLLVEEP